MTPTDQLKEEHEGILLMLKILGEVCSRLAARQKVDPNHPGRIVEFFRVFADKCHHGKEEGLLFPEMEKAGVPKERGPIGVMLAEHDQGRGYVRAMGEAAVRLKKGDPGGAEEFVENARNYITLLAQHIEKENSILFPMGEKVIPQEKQQALVKAFERLEREQIGEGTHEEFHQLLHQLKEIYLP